MAEKEERIWLEYDIPKPKGAVEATRCTTMTRQEAIERMAKVRYAQSPCYDARGNKVSFEDFREDYKPCYEDLIKEVEPLLNALLE